MPSTSSVRGANVSRQNVSSAVVLAGVVTLTNR